MSAFTFKYTCASCNTSFEASGVSDFSYGEFVMRSEKGHEVYLEAISSPVFKEVADMVETHPLLAHENDSKRGDVVQKVFSVACDVDLSGKEYAIGVMPKCPNCGSHKMASWDQVSPPRSSSIPSVSHSNWLSLSDAQKLAKVDKAIRDNL